MKKHKIINTELIEKYETNPDYSKHSNRFKYRNIDNTVNSKFIFVRTNEEDSIYNECIKSPIYFIEKIFNMKLYDWQIDAIMKIHNNQKTYIFNTRQDGITKLMDLYILWCLCFTNDIIGIYQNYNRSKISNIGEMYLRIPCYLKPNLVSFSSSIIETSKSKLTYITKTHNYDFMVYDDNYGTENIPQLNTNGKIVAAHGLGNYGGIIDFLKDFLNEVLTQTNNYIIIKKDNLDIIDTIGESYKYEYGLDVVDFLINYKK